MAAIQIRGLADDHRHMTVPGEDVVIEIRGITVTLHPEHLAVMRLMTRGLTYWEIGQELDLSRYGVRKRIVAVCDALGATNRIEALVLLLRERIV